jgi:HPt (histidine-containing phosphotransfer) domain-containing protein
MILDKQVALERIEYDQELYDEICGIFRDDVPQIMAQLKEAFNVGDIPVATRSAHSLKSAAANIGATRLYETAKLAESALRAGELANINTLIAEIDQNLLRVMEVLA